MRSASLLFARTARTPEWRCLGTRGVVVSPSAKDVRHWQRCARSCVSASGEASGRQGAETASSSSSSGAATASAAVAPGRRVDRLLVSETVKQNLYGIGVTKLSEIQARAFNPILQGRNFVGRSRTGTGKTIAYLLPLLERMRQEKMTAAHSVLVLLPTRELCKQVGSTVLSLSVATDVALVYGGPSLASQEQLVRLGPSVVVSTPGRCARLIERGALEVQNVRVLVIDEADAMLGLEYIGRVQKVIEAVSKDRLQGVLFSASMSPEMLTTVNRYFLDYQLVDLVNREGVRSIATVDAVTHVVCRCPRDRNGRLRILLHVLSRKLDETGGRCIIFVDSVSEAKSLLSHPVLDRKARAFHAEMTVQDRDTVLTSFANREFDVLVATDMVSRGVDFDDVSLVLQLHPPKDAAQYVHRAGRTGRAGRAGTSVMFYDSTERKLVNRVRETTRQKFRTEMAPGVEEIHHAAVSRLLDDLLTVQPEEYGPVIATAESMLQEQGPRILATAMAVLDGRHADLSRATEEPPSLLTGREGFVCFLAHDPDHTLVESEGSLRNILVAILPSRAGDEAVGKIARVRDGWAADVARRWSSMLRNDIRTGRHSLPFELNVAQQLPRLARSSGKGGARRLPWAASRRAALQRGRDSGAPLDHRGPRYDGRLPGAT